VFGKLNAAHGVGFSFTKILFYSIFFTAPFRDARIIDFLSIQDILIITRLSILLLSAAEKRSLSGKHFLTLGIIFFIFCVLQSFLTSVDPTESSINSLKFVLTFFLLPVVFINDCQDKSTFNIAIWSFIIGSVISSLASILVSTTSGISNGDRVSGFAGHPVFFGILSGLALSIALVSFPKTLILQIFHVLGIAIVAYALALSASSTGFSFIVLTFFIIMVRDLFSLNIGRLLRITTFCLLSFLAFWNLDVFAFSRARLFQSLNPSAGFSTNAVSGTSTLEARVFSIRYGWERILESPIFGNGMDVSGRITDVNLEPHNFFIIGWQSGGILVLSAMIIFSVFSFKALLSALLKNELPKITIILVTWLALLSSPLLYERSVISPLILVLCTWLVESKKVPINRI
jgi:hypothetical protein